MLRPAPASPARPAHHRPLSTTMPAKPKPMKRPASKAAAAAEPFEEAGGAAAAAPAPKKAKAVKKRAPSPTPSPDTATTTSSPPVSPSSQGERVQNGWESMRETGEPYLMWKRFGTPAYSGKVAAFDLDGTLLLPTTDRPADWGPTSASDWRYFNGTVPDRLAALVEDGYEVCVLSNQGTIRAAHSGKAAEKVTGRADAALAGLAPATPVTVVFCTASKADGAAARKPGRGMWDFYVSVTRPPAAPPVEVGASFYCGDAAGRAAGENTATPGEPDFADTDAAFAAGVGLAFKTPEEVFGPAESLADARARPGAIPGDKGGTGPNAALVSLFRRIAAHSEGFRAVAVKKAAAVLEALTEPATDLKQLKAMAGIGKSSLAWISEFISTGDIAAAHEAKAPPPPAKEGHGALAFA